MAEVLLPKMVGISPFVSPLEDLVGWDVDVLELPVLIVAALGVGLGEVAQLGHGHGSGDGAADESEYLWNDIIFRN